MDKVAAGIQTDAPAERPASGREGNLGLRRLAHLLGEGIEPRGFFILAQSGRIEPAFEHSGKAGMIEPARMFDPPPGPVETELRRPR